MSPDLEYRTLIGHEGSEYLAIQHNGRDQEGWSTCTVIIKCDGWSGSFQWNCYKEELRQFADELNELYRTLSGRARLNPIEPNLQLTAWGDGKGHIEISGKAIAQFASGTFLVFKLTLDQTDIPGIVKSLRAAEERATS